MCEAEAELAGRIVTLVKVGKGPHRLDDGAYLKERRPSIGILAIALGIEVPARAGSSILNQLSVSEYT